MKNFIKIALFLVMAGALFYTVTFYEGQSNDGQDAMLQAPLLVTDAEGDNALPKRFRRMSDQLEDTSLPMTGLEKLHASGSGQFSEKQLIAVKDLLAGKQVIIVDLRQESHGFINGEPVSWYGVANAANRDKTREEILRDEKEKFAAIKALTEVEVATIHSKEEGVIKDYSPIPVEVEEVKTEEELGRSVGFGYQRFTVRDHAAPSDAQVDGYISFIRDLPEDTWLHVHCRGGKGRTTTFLAVYDMMQNAKEVSLHDIIARQQALGGSDLFKAKEAVDAYKQQDASKRKQFLERFYQYAKENNDGFKTLWTEWLKQGH